MAATLSYGSLFINIINTILARSLPEIMGTANTRQRPRTIDVKRPAVRCYVQAGGVIMGSWAAGTRADEVIE